MRKYAPVIRWLNILAMIGCGGAVIASFLGRHHWFLDLFSHFQLQYFAILLGIAIIFAILRSWKLLAATALVLLPSAFQSAYYLPVASPSSIPAAFRVTSHNVLTSNSGFAEVLNYHQRSDAEIIVLLEINDAWVENLSPLINSHPHRIILPREDNFGIALYSSFPITAQTTDTLPPGIPVLSATIATHQGPVHIIAAHPIPPMGAAYQRARNAYLHQVAGMANQQDGPTIVLGDFNSSPWSPAFRDLVRSTGLRDSGRHRGFQSTWNRHHPLKSIPIDHVLHTPDLQVFDRHIGPGLGSDHHPVHVTFSVGARQDHKERRTVAARRHAQRDAHAHLVPPSRAGARRTPLLEARQATRMASWKTFARRSTPASGAPLPVLFRVSPPLPSDRENSRDGTPSGFRCPRPIGSPRSP